MSVYDDTINLFNVVVLEDYQNSNQTHFSLQGGYVTNFLPNPAQTVVLEGKFKAIDVLTLFSKEERMNSSPEQLILKQILHYVEVYGLGMPGLFNLEVGGGKLVTLNFVSGVTKAEISEMVLKILYSNAPVKDIAPFLRIIEEYRIKFDIDKVLNNELRVALFNPETMKYKNGDDAVRYIVYVTTGDTLLIKSKKVIELVLANGYKIPVNFLENHAFELSQVFNRHKRIIMGLKATHKTIINKISRMSKKNHVAVHESIVKRFISGYLSGEIKNIGGVVEKMSTRDKFKILNLLRYKRMQKVTDAFVIRNGKVHVNTSRKVMPLGAIGILERHVLEGLRSDLLPLRSQNILLDRNVDYGLPVSRKQTLGKLPFGSQVTIDGNQISAGIHWRNEWGARDLDLSTIDETGNRVGWGMYSGYESSRVVYSGDITSAPDGAMEFMTSRTNLLDLNYGLFVSVYSGGNDAQFEVVIGNSTQKQWMDNVVVREKIESGGKNGIFGFVREGKFYAYKLSTGGSYISGNAKDIALIAKSSAPGWTVSELFFELGINFDVDKDSEKAYDYDMSYNQFSYDKLENLLGI